MRERAASPHLSADTAALPPRRRRGRTYAISAALLGGQVVSALALALVAIITARTLGPHERGVLVVCMTVTALVAPIAGLGVSYAGRTLLAGERGTHLVGPYWRLASVSSLASLATSLPILWTTLNSLDRTNIDAMLPFALHAGLGVAAVFAVDATYARGSMVRAVILEASGPTIQVILVTVLTVAGAASITEYAWALLAGTFVQVAVGRPRLSSLDRHLFWKGDSKALLSAGVRGLPAQLVQGVGYRSDRLLIAWLATPAAVGIYSVAATIAELLWLPALAASRLLWRLATHGVPMRGRLLLTITLLTMCAVPVAIAAPTVVRIAFGQEYVGAIPLVNVLLVGTLGVGIAITAGAALSGRGMFSFVSALNAAAIVVVIVLDVVVISRWGVMGAAVVSACTYLAMGLGVAARAVVVRAPAERCSAS